MENTPAIPPKFDELMKLEKIERHHLDILTTVEKDDFLKLIHSKIPYLHGEEFDKYVEQTSSLLDKNEIWEFNHTKIAIIIERYVKENGTMPTTANIASATKLSRPTVRKHLKDLSASPNLSDQNNGIALMLPRVMGGVLRQALNGDLKAAKIYMDAATKQKETSATVINQNNYLQINNTIINQQLIEQLTPGQLKKIELIITGNDNDIASSS
jgi:hypothetical protein